MTMFLRIVMRERECTRLEGHNYMFRIGAATLAVLLLVCALAGAGYAQKKPPAASAPAPLKEVLPAPQQETTADDPLGRSTPHGTVIGFIKAVGREDYERAVEYLDTKQPQRRAQQLARDLGYILDWGFIAKSPSLSRKPEGDLADAVRPNREKIGTIKTESGSYDITLERVQRGSDPPIWLFSSETLKQVPTIYEELESPWVERNIPKQLLETRILRYPAWSWLLLILGLPLAFLITWLLSRALVPLLKVLVRRLTRRQMDRAVARLTGPIRVLVLALAIYLVSLASYSLLSSLFWSGVAATVAIIGAAWLCLRLTDIAADRLEERGQVPETSGRVAMTRLVSKLFKGLIVIVAAVIIFYGAGINLTAVLTGLGVGGLAVAFAAQKTLENLFGGVMIISDRPIRVGDFCRAGDYRGTVEDIGLRSTRIRTPDRTVVFVPNGQLATMSLENFTMRDKILFNHKINLKYETSSEQLLQVLTEIRKMFREHPKVETETGRVRFTALRDSWYELEVFAYVLETAFETFLEIQEDLLLHIVRIVEETGASFAFPSRTMYVQHDTDWTTRKEKGS